MLKIPSQYNLFLGMWYWVCNYIFNEPIKRILTYNFLGHYKTNKRTFTDLQFLKPTYNLNFNTQL